MPMSDKTIKRWLLDCDAALASDDGPIFWTVAKLVDALKRSIPEGTQNAELKRKHCALGVICSAGPSTRNSEKGARPDTSVRDMVQPGLKLRSTQR